jgi:bacterial/archaeal transporter family-2 protein
MGGGTGAAAVLALVAGVAGSVQVAVMGRLGERVGALEALAFASVLTALIATVLLLAARGSLAGIGDAARQPLWLWLGGAMSALIVFTVTFAAPRVGTAATIALLIAGQLAMGVVIDRFGLFGLERIGLGGARVAGVLLLAAGAALMLRR